MTPRAEVEPMDEAAVLARLTEIFRDVFDDPGITISRATTADDIEDWDSLTNINIVVATEKDFDLRFELVELAGLENVGSFVDLILGKASSE